MVLIKSNTKGEEANIIKRKNDSLSSVSATKRENLMGMIKSNPNPKAEEANIDPSDLLDEEKETHKAAILSLSETAEKMDPSSLATFLEKVSDEDWYHPLKQILKVIDYYGIQLSQVSSFHWVNMFDDYPLSKLIHVPLSLIPMSVYEQSLDFINTLPFETLPAVVLWASDLILTEWPGVVKVEQLNSDLSKVATFVVLAMVLRTKPDALTLVLPKLRDRPTYQGQDKLPFIIWMMAQASQGDLCAGLYSWVRNLLPLVVKNKSYSSQSIDLILQSLEMFLSSNPEARAVLLNEPVRHGERLIPPRSFEILVRLTFPARVGEATERFEAIYPLLKEVALAPDTITSANALKQIFTFSLKLAGGQGNPDVAKEAIEIAIRSVTENVDCFKQWDILYKENLEASVALLKKLVDEWEDHSFKLLSSSSSDALTVKHAIYRFRMKNEKTITKGVANSFLYEEADKSCKLILRKLSRGSGGRKITPCTTMVIAAAAAVAGAALVLQEAPHLLVSFILIFILIFFSFFLVSFP
ncbi:uncharacterized protein BNAA09G51360D isoform X1 [Brassica napus]|nr:uncharacterized protein BNAA09G51360D isoform X1 [Brassica napus]